MHRVRVGHAVNDHVHCVADGMTKRGKMPDGTGLVLWEDEGDGWIAAYPVAKKSRLVHGWLYPHEGERFCITVNFKNFWDASRAFDTLIC